MSRRFQNFLFAVLLLVIAPSFLFAQTTGKIRGKVTDRETGDVLPGANVLIVGTSLGAATDVNGDYFIFNVPVGVYSMRCTFIGYRTVTISNIKVSGDLTTTVDFELPSEAVELSEIQIVAERPLVNKSATNAVRITSGESFEKLPVRTTQQIYGLQPGVVVQDDQVYIRGGRKDEVGYMVEGANAKNVVTGENAVSVIPEALAEAQIQAGGYNAEFGGANAGIIQQTFKSGTPDFHGRFQVETDQFPSQSRGEKALDGYSYGYEDYVMTLSGPIYKNKITAFVALERTVYDDSRQVFWTGLDVQQVVNDVYATNPEILQINQDNVRLDENGNLVIVDTGRNGQGAGDVFPRYVTPSGNIPDYQNQNTLNGTLNFDFNPILFRFSVASSFRNDQITGQRPLLNQLGSMRFGRQEQSADLFTGKFTHLLSNNTFYEIGVNYFDRRAQAYDPNFGSNYLAYFDSLEVDRVLGPEISSNFRGRAQQPAPYDIFRFPFQRPGVSFVNFYSKEKQNYISGTFDLTTQISNHAVKFGGSYETWTVRLATGLGTQGAFQQMLAQPDLARAIRNGPSDPRYGEALLLFRRSGNVNAYGYDVFGNEVDSDSQYNDGPKKPTFGSVYLQDKFEAGDLVVNAGVRLDVFDFDQTFPTDLEAPTVDVTNFDIPPGALQSSSTKTEVSPRLGFAFPVTDRTVFHVQYGRFVQAPQFLNLYSGRGYLALVLGAGNYIFNPAVGREIEPIKTVQYEIGFSQAMTDFASFDVTAFYRDVKGQLQIALETVDNNRTNARSYNLFQNQDFATTKGLEFALNLRRVERIAASLNYTFSDAQSTGSFPNSNIGAVSLTDPIPKTVAPVDFDQRHRGSIAFDYRFGRGDGGPILERAGLNLLFSFNSGHPYTLSGGGIAQQGPDQGGVLNSVDPRGRSALESLNSSTTPWVSTVDLRLDKTVSIGPMAANFYIYVQNLFNTKTVLNVYQRTGNADNDGFLTNPDLSSKIVEGAGPAFVELYKIVNLDDRQGWWFNNLGSVNNFGGTTDAGSVYDMFGTPRQFRFGVSFEY